MKNHKYLILTQPNGNSPYEFSCFVENDKALNVILDEIEPGSLVITIANMRYAKREVVHSLEEVAFEPSDAPQ